MKILKKVFHTLRFTYIVQYIIVQFLFNHYLFIFIDVRVVARVLITCLKAD